MTLIINNRPHTDHLKSANDLETSYAAYRAGFVSLALERNRRATPFVDEARKLKAIAAQAKNPSELLKIKEIRSALLTAAGVSDKASGDLEETDKMDAITGLIRQFEPAGADFVGRISFSFPSYTR